MHKVYFRLITKWRPNKWQPVDTDSCSKKHVYDRTILPMVSRSTLFSSVQEGTQNNNQVHNVRYDFNQGW